MPLALDPTTGIRKQTEGREMRKTWVVFLAAALAGGPLLARASEAVELSQPPVPNPPASTLPAVPGLPQSLPPAELVGPSAPSCCGECCCATGAKGTCWQKLCAYFSYKPCQLAECVKPPFSPQLPLYTYFLYPCCQEGQCYAHPAPRICPPPKRYVCCPYCPAPYPKCPPKWPCARPVVER